MSASARRRDLRTTLRSHERVNAPIDGVQSPTSGPAAPASAHAQHRPAMRPAGGSLGAAPGQTRLPASGTARPLSSSGSVLPELAVAPQQERKWWRHPAFLVSLGLTVVALGTAATLLIIAAVNDDAVTVSGLSAEVSDGNLHLDWSGPDAAYSLYTVDGDGTATDLTQLVRGTEAWVFSAAGLYDDDSCFVVRPTGVEGEVALDAKTLDAQRAQSVCVTDATA